MNVMTLILSITASILTAALILVWQNDSSAAEKEPDELRKANIELTSQVQELKAKLHAHGLAQQEQAQGNAAVSPYGSSIQSVAAVKQDEQKIKAKMAEIQRNKDMISKAPLTETPVKPEENLADLEMTSSALLSQGVNKEEALTDNGSSPVQTEALTRTKQRERSSEIRNSKVYAKVAHIQRNPEGDIILAKLEPNTFLETGSELSVRRNDGISGRVRIVAMQDYPQHGTVLTLENLSGASLVLKSGDHLILPPRWEAPVTK